MTYELVAIGASWGGLRALERILRDLPADFEPAIVIAQHRSANATDSGLAGLLARHAGRAVQDAADKTAFSPGSIYLAPADYHLLVEPGHFSLSVDERVQHARPSVDVLFESVADVFRERAIGIVLTGANGDGAHGLARIKELGGVAIVQDPRSAEAQTMPAAALRAVDADAVLALDEIAAFLTGLCVPAGSETVR